MRQDNVQRKVHGASWFFLSLICVYLCVVMILWKTNIGSHITMVQNLILSQSMIFVPTIIYILISKCDLRETLRLKKTHWLAIIIVPAFVVALEPLMTLINAISLLWVESATTELATGLVSNHKLWVLPDCMPSPSTGYSTGINGINMQMPAPIKVQALYYIS